MLFNFKKYGKVEVTSELPTPLCKCKSYAEGTCPTCNPVKNPKGLSNARPEGSPPFDGDVQFSKGFSNTLKLDE